MAPLPLMADSSRAARPVATRGAQAALSPNLGELARPGVWHMAQFWL